MRSISPVILFVSSRPIPTIDHMPALSYISVVTILAFAAPCLAAVLSVLAPSSASAPGPMDAWATLGALLATAIMAIGEGKPGTGNNWRSRVITIFVSCAFVGSFGPGFVIYTVVPYLPFGWGEDFSGAAESLTWQGWAMLGFVLGISGWAFVRLLIAVVNMSQRWGLSEAERRLGVEADLYRDNADKKPKP